jgi:hypothetical protein
MTRTGQEKVGLSIRKRRVYPRIKAGHAVLLRTPNTHPQRPGCQVLSSTGRGSASWTRGAYEAAIADLRQLNAVLLTEAERIF